MSIYNLKAYDPKCKCGRKGVGSFDTGATSLMTIAAIGALVLFIWKGRK